MQGSISFDGTLAGSIAGGGGGGTTPLISADATVDSLSGDPTCTVSRTGTDEMPTFHFAFSGIVGEEGPEGPEGPEGAQGPAGEDGADGADGVTPEVTASATVDSSTGTPSVTVTKSGTTAAPNFAFAFSNLKGETGATGATGPQGPAGVGVPSGGATGDVLRKDSTTDYDTYWDTLTALDIPYDNTSSGMTATNTQAAITELKSNLTQLNGLNVVKRITTPATVVSFSDGSNLPMYKLLLSIEPVQEGSGDPSPENIRHISGFTEANVIVSPTEDAEDGTTYTIQFQYGSNPLTVYGGTLDVVSGLLTVDRGILTLNGSEYYYTIQTSSVDGNTVLRVATRQACKQNENQKSNYGTFNNNAWQELNRRANTFVLGSEGNLYLQLPSNTASTVEEFKALFASNNLQVVYELTTPQTYQLTPTQVKSLLGTNNVWADTGDILEVDYTAILNFS